MAPVRFLLEPSLGRLLDDSESVSQRSVPILSQTAIYRECVLR